MKHRQVGILVAIACACLLPVTARAQKANIDYDKEVNFSKFRTYAWIPGTPAPNPLVHKRILNAIEGQLASKGWTKSETSPNAIVVYHAGIDEQKQLNGWNGGPRWNGTVNVDTILIGQLVVDIYDAETEQLVWRGFVSDTIGDKAEKNEKKMNEAVGKLFKQFPPNRAH